MSPVYKLSDARSILGPNTYYTSMLAGNTAFVAAGNAYEYLETITPTGSQSEVSFTNLATAYSASYQHLQIRYTLRTTRIETDDALVIRFGGPSNTYSTHILLANGSTVTSGADSNGPHMYIGQIPSNNFTASAYGAGVIDILDAFETTKKKTLRSLAGETGSANQIILASGSFHGTGNLNALSTIVIASANGGNFTTDSRIRLYGLKG